MYYNAKVTTNNIFLVLNLKFCKVINNVKNKKNIFIKINNIFDTKLTSIIILY